jgi:putative SOS response-associated peptidase YedK
VKDYYEFLKNADIVFDDDDYYGFESEKLIDLPNNHIRIFSYLPVIVSEHKPKSHSYSSVRKEDIKPTHSIKIIPARWGLVPFWAKDETIATKTFNARFETVHEKPSFKYAYKQRRCLVPFTGFYEKSIDLDRYYFRNSKNGLKSFAGLYEIWEGIDKKNKNNPLITFSIITREPKKGLFISENGKDLIDIHHRMPWVLNEEQAVNYLIS